MAEKVGVEKVVKLFLSQVGDPYRFGYEIPPGTADPAAGDCSEYLQWATQMAGVEPPLPDGSWLQYLYVAERDGLISVPAGINTRGALLFRFSETPRRGKKRPKSSHVALSLGDGRTMEARSTRLGVGVFSAMRRGWTHAGLIPFVSYADSTDGRSAVDTVLRQGAHGRAVSIAQGLLLAAGFGPAGLVIRDGRRGAGRPDGGFGPRTRRAVMSFQTRSGLVADGVVGPLTWAALLGVPVAR